jgi:hypothetical protein
MQAGRRSDFPPARRLVKTGPVQVIQYKEEKILVDARILS